MHVTRYSLGCGLLSLHEFHLKSGGITAASWPFVWVSHETREESVSTVSAAASASRESCCGCSISQERGCVVLGGARAAAGAAASARSQQMCHSYGSLPTLGSGTSAHSEI